MIYAKYFKLIFFASVILWSQSTAESAKSLLLVIDMQKDILTPGKGGLRLDSSQVNDLIRNVNYNIHLADSSGIPIAYIQNEWTNPVWIFFAGNICKKGAVGTNFDPRLLIKGSLTFHKSVPNSFSNKELLRFIERNAIDTLFITGMKSEGCVGSTARNGLKRGLQTILITPAIGSNSTSTLNGNIASLVKKGAKTIQSLKDRR